MSNEKVGTALCNTTRQWIFLEKTPAGKPKWTDCVWNACIFMSEEIASRTAYGDERLKAMGIIDKGIGGEVVELAIYEIIQPEIKVGEQK